MGLGLGLDGCDLRSQSSGRSPTLTLSGESVGEGKALCVGDKAGDGGEGMPDEAAAAAAG